MARFELAGRTALVTGGGSGIGRGIALALAGRGVRVALAGRRPGPLDEVAAAIQAGGGVALALPADISRSDERAALLERAGALGPLDILVNNAGLLAGGELARLAPEQIEAAVAVNLLAPMLLARQCLDELARRRGAIVLVGSMMSLVPIPAAPLYSATKAGLYAFGESLRYELRPRGIHLLTALPPGTATAMTAAMARRASPKGYPPARLADPEQLGERIVAALAARRERVQWGTGERALTWLYRWAPGLARPLLGRSRPIWARMLNEPDE